LIPQPQGAINIKARNSPMLGNFVKMKKKKKRKKEEIVNGN
jgi:hypothetical protein